MQFLRIFFTGTTYFRYVGKFLNLSPERERERQRLWVLIYVNGNFLTNENSRFLTFEFISFHAFWLHNQVFAIVTSAIFYFRKKERKKKNWRDCNISHCDSYLNCIAISCINRRQFIILPFFSLKCWYFPTIHSITSPLYHIYPCYCICISSL